MAARFMRIVNADPQQVLSAVMRIPRPSKTAVAFTGLGLATLGYAAYMYAINGYTPLAVDRTLAALAFRFLARCAVQPQPDNTHTRGSALSEARPRATHQLSFRDARGGQTNQT